MDSVKSWLFGKQKSGGPEAMPSSTTVAENRLQAEEKDNKGKHDLKETPSNLDNTTTTSKDGNINLTKTIENVSEKQESVNLEANVDENNNKGNQIFRTTLFTVCYYSIYKHAGYATRKLGIMQIHLKALNVLLFGAWSHYMLLEYYLPYTVKYGPDGEKLPKDFKESIEHLNDKVISAAQAFANKNANDIKESVVISEKSLQPDLGQKES